MRNLLAIILMIIICSASVAYGGNKRTSGDLSHFANEIAAKLVYRPDANISVRAHDCRLHIEYGALEVAFDLPLKGTTLEENGSEDGIILSNANLTRTVKNRVPEVYERIILRFDRKTVKMMMTAFEDAIAACGGGKKVAAAQ